ncbi:MAG: zf-HC2 domain-containing protein [Elusimicrobia bacterium]|nr:zf-HC2 domain-containing protein [Elusimicrobiota bacterium]
MKGKDHVRDHLSAYADRELSPELTKLVEKHLAACSECRASLSDLRSLSKMLAGMPKRGLPEGFLARLKARRAREAGTEIRGLPFFAWTPPVRAAAMALSAFMVMFVAYEGLRTRPSSGAPASAPEASLNADGTPTMAELREAARKAVEPAAPGPQPAKAETDQADGTSQALSDLKAVAAARGRYKSAGILAAGEAAALPSPALAGGAPLAESGQAKPSYTNEQLQAMLETEKKRTGITILPPEEKNYPSDEELLGTPNPDRQVIAAKSAPLRLEGDTPALISPTSLLAGGQAAPAPKAADYSLVRAGRQMRSFELPAGPGRDLPAEARDFGKLEVFAARTQAQLDGLWTRFDIELPRPTVDFSRQMLVLVPPSEEDNSACDILTSEEAGASLLVRCRHRESSYAERPTAASFRVIPLTPLPPRLEALK